MLQSPKSLLIALKQRQRACQAHLRWEQKHFISEETRGGSLTWNAQHVPCCRKLETSEGGGGAEGPQITFLHCIQNSPSKDPASSRKRALIQE